MKIAITGQLGSLIGPLETTDKAFADDVGRIILGIRNSLGTLDDLDVARVESILRKYTPSDTTNQLSTTRASDAAEAAGRRAAARARAGVMHNQAVATGYKVFWGC
jgi:hypothetical protein